VVQGMFLVVLMQLFWFSGRHVITNTLTVTFRRISEKILIYTGVILFALLTYPELFLYFTLLTVNLNY
jgi:hypothetical protein